jgi:hypothetical protein
VEGGGRGEIIFALPPSPKSLTNMTSLQTCPGSNLEATFFSLTCDWAGLPER